MLASIVLSILLQLRGQKEPPESLPIPGEISVTYRDGVTSDQRKALEKNVGLPEPTPGLLSGTLWYKVPKGHEEFWKEVLVDFPIVASAEQPWSEGVRKLRSTEAELRLRGPFKTSPRGTTSGSFTEMLGSKISQYFLDNYSAFAAVRVVKRGDDFVQLSIDKMKGQVIAGQQFWERLDVYLVFFRSETGAKLHVVYDGYFATGIGSRPPPDQSYSDMSNDYGSDLSRYADITTTALKSYIEKDK